MGCRVERCMERLTPIGVWREFVLWLSHGVQMHSGAVKLPAGLLGANIAPLAANMENTEAGPGTASDCATRLSHRFPEEGKLLLQRWLAVFHREPSCIRTLPAHSLSNSPPPIYFSITDSLPLKLVYLLAGVTDDNDAEPC